MILHSINRVEAKEKCLIKSMNGIRNNMRKSNYSIGYENASFKLYWILNVKSVNRKPKLRKPRELIIRLCDKFLVFLLLFIII